MWPIRAPSGSGASSLSEMGIHWKELIKLIALDIAELKNRWIGKKSICMQMPNIVEVSRP